MGIPMEIVPCCPKCNEPVAVAGAHVKISRSKLYHVKCYVAEVEAAAYNRGRKDVLVQQEAEARRVREEQEAKERAAKELADAKALAVKNAELEKQRLAQLTAKAREDLKKEQQGEGKDRFALIEIDEPAAPPPKEERKCVRCGSLEVTDYHPRHCTKCWVAPDAGVNTEAVKSDPMKALTDAGIIRPIELD